MSDDLKKNVELKSFEIKNWDVNEFNNRWYSIIENLNNFKNIDFNYPFLFNNLP